MKEFNGWSQSTGRERLGQQMCDENVLCMEMGWAGVKEEICRHGKDKQSSPWFPQDASPHMTLRTTLRSISCLSPYASSQSFVASIQAVLFQISSDILQPV